MKKLHFQNIYDLFFFSNYRYLIHSHTSTDIDDHLYHYESIHFYSREKI